MMAQPVLRSSNPVGNAGSYDTKIAQGSIFVVFGTNLGGDAVVQNASLPIKTSLGNASIRLTPVSGGAAVDAYMIYTTKNQLAGLLPSNTPVGDYNLTVTYNGATSASGRTTVTAQGFGIVSRLRSEPFHNRHIGFLHCRPSASRSGNRPLWDRPWTRRSIRFHRRNRRRQDRFGQH